MRSKRYLFFTVYFLLFVFLTLYSYSQIDLNLTLTGNPVYQSFQKQMIWLGYFNRPLSSLIYAIIILLLFLFYIFILRSVRNKLFTVRKITIFLLAGMAVLFLSYPAFSHDIFNYMFDARIVTKYFSNPYIHSALNYPDDLWTRFMHWTHRTYPYGPVWLLVTLPVSLAGLGKFVATLAAFKSLFILFHLGNVYLISRIMEKINPKDRIKGVVFYALNPLIMIESLVSPHNEVMMLFFLLLSIDIAFIRKNILTGFISLLFSIGIKFATFTVVPVLILYKLFPDRTKTRNWILAIFIFMVPSVLLEIIYRQIYPWYFIPLIGVSALLTEYKLIPVIISAVSLSAMLFYLPYLYLGEYTVLTHFWENTLFLIPLIAVLAVVIFKRSRTSL